MSFSEFFNHFTEYYVRYGKFAFIYLNSTGSFPIPRYLEQREICLGLTRLFPIPRYLEQRETCLGFGHKYNISSYLLLRR